MSNNVKRAIKKRMEETGESYSTARRHILMYDRKKATKDSNREPSEEPGGEE